MKNCNDEAKKIRKKLVKFDISVRYNIPPFRPVKYTTSFRSEKYTTAHVFFLAGIFI